MMSPPTPMTYSSDWFPVRRTMFPNPAAGAKRNCRWRDRLLPICLVVFRLIKPIFWQRPRACTRDAPIARTRGTSRARDPVNIDFTRDCRATGRLSGTSFIIRGPLKIPLYSCARIPSEMRSRGKACTTHLEPCTYVTARPGFDLHSQIPK